jgi:hypothetical protein
VAISFRQPIITRGGNEVRIYHVYENYIHGAYERNGLWFIAAWRIDGHFLEPNEKGKQPIATLDLINDDGEWLIPDGNPRMSA